MLTLHIVVRALAWIEGALDRVRYSLKRLTGFGPLRVVVFRGHGTPARVLVWGRVLEDRGVEPAAATHSRWRNVRDMYRRFASREVPHVSVRIEAAGAALACETNREGYFRAELRSAEGRQPPAGWQPVRVTAAIGDANVATARGEALVITKQRAEFAVISDIDDTILQTGATRFLAMLRHTVVGNARTRRPFHGVRAFYRALAAGYDGGARNPIFYVSSSPWNLYDFLIDFMAHQDIPKGPLYLRDLGIEKEKFIATDRTEHKLSCIREIMSAHGDLPFALIGDSGQDDPEIYRTVALEQPGRVKAIYIRDVERSRRRESIRELTGELAARGVPLVLSVDTLGAAAHAAELGLIAPGAVDEVQAELERDRATPDEFSLAGR